MTAKAYKKSMFSLSHFISIYEGYTQRLSLIFTKSIASSIPLRTYCIAMAFIVILFSHDRKNGTKMAEYTAERLAQRF
jgi:hypothetical protein